MKRLLLCCLLGVGFHLSAATDEALFLYTNAGFAVTLTGLQESFEEDTLTIPKKINSAFIVRTIGEGAFANLTTLKTVVIPNSVTRINAGAFEGCTSLTYVHFEGTPPSKIDPTAFPSSCIITYSSEYASHWEDAFLSNEVWAQFNHCLHVTLTTEVNGNGTIRIEGAKPYYLEGEEVNVFLEPDDGSALVAINDASLKSPATSVVSHRQTLSDTDCVITGTFKDFLPVVVNCVGNGSVTAEPSSAIAGYYVTLTAIPGDDACFYKWTNGYMEDTVKLRMTEDATLTTAYFVDRVILTTYAQKNDFITQEQLQEFVADEIVSLELYTPDLIRRITLGMPTLSVTDDKTTLQFQLHESDLTSNATWENITLTDADVNFSDNALHLSLTPKEERTLTVLASP